MEGDGKPGGGRENLLLFFFSDVPGPPVSMGGTWARPSEK